MKKNPKEKVSKQKRLIQGFGVTALVLTALPVFLTTGSTLVGMNRTASAPTEVTPIQQEQTEKKESILKLDKEESIEEKIE